jgi:hypothetical protein
VSVPLPSRRPPALRAQSRDPVQPAPDAGRPGVSHSRADQSSFRSLFDF